MPYIKVKDGDWWIPQSVCDEIKAASPVELDEHRRPKTLWGRPIKYVDDLPPVPEDLFVPKPEDTA